MMEFESILHVLEDPELDLGRISSDENDSFRSDEFGSFEVTSLEESCIGCVVKNFGRFNAAFLNTDDRHLSRNFLFLRKVYTRRLIQIMPSITDEYVSFFLHEYLKDFHLSWFDRSGFPAVVKTVKEIGHTLLAMNLTSECCNDFPSQVICDILSSSPNVVQLDLPSYVNRNVLCVLAASCRKLKVLRFDKRLSNFIPSDFFQVLNIPTLQEIDYRELPIIIYLAHERDYQNKTLNTVKKYNLVKLNFAILIQNLDDFFMPYLHDIFIVCSELCPLVKNISILAMGQRHVDLLNSFQELQSLNVQGYLAHDSYERNVNELLKLRADNLTEISLRKCCVSIFSLLKCSKLKTLVLDQVVYDNVCDSNSYLLNDLENFTMRNVVFENSPCFTSNVNILQLVLSSSPNLHKLSLYKCNINESLPQTIIIKACTNTALKLIHFKNSDGVTADFVKLIYETCQHECLLSICYCSPINQEDIDLIKEINKKVNLDYFQRYSYSSSDDYNYSDDYSSSNDYRSSDDYSSSDDHSYHNNNWNNFNMIMN